MAAEPTPTRRAPFIAVALYYLTYGLVIGIVVLTVWLAWPGIVATWHARMSGTTAAPQATAPAGNVGGQAPASVRGTNPDPILPTAIIATPIPNIALDEAESLRIYQATAQASFAAPAAVPTAAAAPLPLNSAGEPVIDAQQQQQLQQALDFANAEALDQQALITATAAAAQLPTVLAQSPDVSYEDAKKLLGRDPCHVPRANPHTCMSGLFKPTPIGAP